MVVTNNTRRRRQLLSSVSSAATASLWKHGGKQLLSGGGGIIKRRKISPLKNKNKLFTSTIRLQVVRTTATAAAAATMDLGTQASTTLKSPSSTNNVSIKKFFRRYRRRGSSHGCSKNSSNTCCDADRHVENNKKRSKSGNGSSKKKQRGTKEDANKVETENVRSSLKERGSSVGNNSNDGMNDDDDDNDCNTTFAGGDDDTITTSTTISPMRNSHHHHHHCDDECEEEGEDKNQNYHEKFFPPSPSTVTTPTSTIASTHTNNDFIFTDDSYEDDNVSNTKDCHSIHNDTTTATEQHGVSVADDTTATPELSSFLVNAINDSNNNNNTHNDSLFDDSSDPKEEEDIIAACIVDNGNKQQVIMKERKEEFVSLVKEKTNNNDTDKEKDYKDEASSSSSLSLLADDDNSYHVSFKPSNALYLQAMEGYTAKAKADIELATSIGIKRINSIGSAMSSSSSSSIASTVSKITTTMVKEPESNIIDYLRQFDEIATGTTTTEEDYGGTKQEETTGGDKSSTTCREPSSSTRYPSPSLPETNNNAGRKRIYVCSLLTALSVLIIVILLIPTVMMTMMNDPPSSLDYNHDEDVIMNRARTFFGVLPKDDDNDDDSNEECKANSSNTIMPMTGIVVVVSETNSQLGKELKYHFERLGATVASTDINNCNDLNSVSELIDALLDSHGKIDYLIHTGNLCLFPSPSLLSLSPASIKNYYHNYLNIVQHIGSMILSSSSSIHGYDMLFTGNYIAAFLMTQKLSPYLERSRFGTVVQFASSLATLDVLDGSSLEIDGSNDSSPPTASVLLHQKQRRFVPSFLYLPVQYAYIKIATILSQRAYGRDYPNIRTIEFNNLSWSWMIQDRRSKEINDFFRNLFDTEADASSSSYVSSKLIENENLQEDLYEWSLRAVSKWIATDSSSGSTKENLSTGDWIKKGILFGSESSSSSRNVRRNNKKEATSIFEYRLSISETTTAVVTGTTLAWMAIKAKATWQTFTFQ